MAQVNSLGSTLASHAMGQHRARPQIAAAAGAPDVAWRAETDLYDYMRQRGFHFPRELVTRYLLSLRTKPFALFTGISGTGKTKLALLTAEYYAEMPGTRATRWEQPEDDDHAFYVPIDKVTLRSGTLTPGREQLDYFEVPAGGTETFTATITNVLGAHGDITFRATNLVSAGRKHLTIQVPSSVRRAMEENGVTDRDYLRFEIVDEFKRYRVSLLRPRTELVDVPPADRLAFTSVRPSWNDHTALLGSYDHTAERYERTPVLELLLRASREEREARAAGVAPAPYFIVLDEMNIARIEHYFSDFLSALESRRVDADGSIRQEPLHLHGADASTLVWMDHLGIEYEIPQRLELPTNVLFTGTLNLDDTTFGLSPKVVDRASTMAFSAVDFEGYLAGDAAEDEPDALELPDAVTRELQLGELHVGSASDSHEVAEHLAPVRRAQRAARRARPALRLSRAQRRGRLRARGSGAGRRSAGGPARRRRQLRAAEGPPQILLVGRRPRRDAREPAAVLPRRSAARRRSLAARGAAGPAARRAGGRRRPHPRARGHGDVPAALGRPPGPHAARDVLIPRRTHDRPLPARELRRTVEGNRPPHESAPATARTPDQPGAVPR